MSGFSGVVGVTIRVHQGVRLPVDIQHHRRRNADKAQVILDIEVAQEEGHCSILAKKTTYSNRKTQPSQELKIIILGFEVFAQI